jgi:hypothetical protein
MFPKICFLKENIFQLFLTIYTASKVGPTGNPAEEVGLRII